MARSRGLWVDLAYRNKGYGTQILRETNVKAKALNADAIWSFPRRSSITTYEHAGYTQMSSWLDVGEFGPNCYAICFLNTG
jgi:GNAT superfamily N-acetyltransferase